MPFSLFHNLNKDNAYKFRKCNKIGDTVLVPISDNDRGRHDIKSIKMYELFLL